jgi:hypothetical protein
MQAVAQGGHEERARRRLRAVRVTGARIGRQDLGRGRVDDQLAGLAELAVPHHYHPLARFHDAVVEAIASTIGMQ